MKPLPLRERREICHNSGKERPLEGEKAAGKTGLAACLIEHELIELEEYYFKASGEFQT